MKKAFTITEAIISAAMLGVIAAIVLPMINDFQPNKDKTAYNKALYSMQSAVSNVMDNTFEIAANMGSAYEPSKHLQNLTREQACNAFAENFNTTGTINCRVKGSYEEPNFVTTDGMRFWDIGGSGPFASEEDNDTSQIIKMDRELKQADRNKREKSPVQGDGSKGGEGLKIAIRKDGKVYTPENSETDPYWAYENYLIKEAMSLNNKK